jgi:hypothetical protein
MPIPWHACQTRLQIPTQNAEPDTDLDYISKQIYIYQYKNSLINQYSLTEKVTTN